MSVVFPDSHVDLMGNVTFTRAQLINRWDRELARKWSQPVQDNLRDFMMVKDSLDPAYLQEFTADKQICYTRRMADEAKNELLIQVIAYENAVRRKAELELRLFGREAEPEIPEERDPETGVVTQPFVPALEAVEPLPATVELDGQAVDNPEYLSVAGELQQVDDLIANASQAVQDLANSRQ
jgi:hypothetical protein